MSPHNWKLQKSKFNWSKLSLQKRKHHKTINLPWGSRVRASVEKGFLPVEVWFPIYGSDRFTGLGGLDCRNAGLWNSFSLVNLRSSDDEVNFLT